MQLSKEQIKDLQVALLSGYDEDSLRMMVRVEMGEDLAQLAKGSTLKIRVFDLIEWAEKSGRIFDLIDGAYAQNDGNVEIRRVWEASQTWRKPAAELVQPAVKPAIDRETPNWQRAGIELVRIPAGEFLHGDDKKPVYLDEFWIARTPVTNRQYQMFVAETGHEPPSHWEGKRVHLVKLNHPVVNVSWHDAQSFCEWAGVFLPAEEQWEKAARGTDGRTYPWGNQAPDPQLCNYAGNVGDTTPVGRYSPQGDSPYGLVDMAGNVWEWCENWAIKGKVRALRGGSWYVDVHGVRCAFRYISYPVGRGASLGFRVVSPRLWQLTL